MNELLAVCTRPSCGAVFAPTGFIAGPGAAKLSFTGTYTNCPRCHANARISDGTYSYANEVIKFLDGPAQTREVLERVKAILEAAKASDTPQPIDELVAKISEESPAVATLFQSFLTKLGKVDYKFWIGTLLAIVAILVSHCDSSSSSTQADKIARDQQVRDVVTQALLSKDIELHKKVLTNLATKDSGRNGRNKPCSCGSKKLQRNCCKPYSYKQPRP